jgi:hypothetical protein
MRRLIVITWAFLLFFAAGIASAWAECKQISFGFQGHHHSAGSPHAHDHDHSGNHQSPDPTIHCPTLDDFVPSASFLLRGRTQSFDEVIGSVVSLVSQDNLASNDSNAHGPPFLIFSPVPARLLLSVLRI